MNLYGQSANYSEINKIAKKHGLKVIEDCAQCFLAKDDKNKISGTLSNIGVWSFESSKQITCGEGGIVTCNNKNLAKRKKFWQQRAIDEKRLVVSRMDDEIFYPETITYNGKTYNGL